MRCVFAVQTFEMTARSHLSALYRLFTPEAVTRPGGESKSPHAANGHKPRGQKPTSHRKGQGLARSDVMKVNADGSVAPVMSANALMRHIGSTNPWSQK